jgi:hypothetical protein
VTAWSVNRVEWWSFFLGSHRMSFRMFGKGWIAVDDVGLNDITHHSGKMRKSVAVQSKRGKHASAQNMLPSIHCTAWGWSRIVNRFVYKIPNISSIFSGLRPTIPKPTGSVMRNHLCRSVIACASPTIFRSSKFHRLASES